MIISPENYSKCLKCPHCSDDDEGLYCSLDVCMHRAANALDEQVEQKMPKERRCIL
jgi:hypothetical protein